MKTRPFLQCSWWKACAAAAAAGVIVVVVVVVVVVVLWIAPIYGGSDDMCELILSIAALIHWKVNEGWVQVSTSQQPEVELETI